jgi:divalent metal cation (Fe/Co/Zn/Cd) transporter
LAWSETVEVARRIAVALLMLMLCAWLFAVRLTVGMIALFFEVLSDTLDSFFDVVFGDR